MGTTRFFNGGREPGKRSVASEIMRFEIRKKGKLDPTERYKRILKMKLQESQQKASLMGGPPKTFGLPGSIQEARKMSKKAEQALKDIAARKAAKQAKADRMMVIIQPRNYSTGRLSKNGQISDIAGNIVGTVNRKNGKMITSTGGSLGKYKSKSFMTDLAIQGGIDKYSPYYINLRKMQAMQQGDGGNGVWGGSSGGVIDVHGSDNFHAASNAYGYSAAGGGVFESFGSDFSGPRQNVGVTGWGAMSDNVWGTYNDNVWGTSSDTVWGTNTSDVWGGIGGNPWGNFAKTVRVWGSGNGPNYLKGLANRVAAFFGLNLKTKQSRAAFHEAVSRVRSSRTSGSTRSGGDHGPVTRAPTRGGGH